MRITALRGLALLGTLALLSGCNKESTTDTNSATNNSAAQAVQAEEVMWLTNYDEALALASEKGRRVLINFTGSDWCGWCIRLKDKVFSKPEFQKYAAEKLILLELDFPRRKQLPASLQQQNAKLQEKFGVRGYPTLFLLNPDGKAIGQLGYIPGGPRAFISALESAK